MATTEPILETHDLVKYFGGRNGRFSSSPLVHAVDVVTLSVNRGETFAIVGEFGMRKIDAGAAAASTDRTNRGSGHL